MVLSCEDGATSSCSIFRDEALAVVGGSGRRCGGPSFRRWGRVSEGIVDMGGRGGEGEESGGMELTKMGRGWFSRFAEMERVRVDVSASPSRCAASADVADCWLRAERPLLIVMEDSGDMPFLSFDSISRSPTLRLKFTSGAFFKVPLVP